MFNRSINKVILVGNLGKDPEMRYMPNGNAVANFSIATTESWKNKQTGEYENQTEWHNLTVYGKFGEMCGQYLKKGAKVYVEGKLKTRKWQDKTTGQDKYATDVIVSELQMMDSNNAGQGGQQFQGNQNQQFQGGQQQQAPQQAQQSWGNAPQQQAPQQQAAPQMAPAYQQAPQQAPAPQQSAPAPQQQAAPQAPAQYNEPSMDFDDDIPF